MSAELKLAKAREIVRRDAPYITGLLYALIPIPMPGVGTMCTTEHMVLLYEPSFVTTLEDEQVAGVLMHECAHIFKKHIQRFGEILRGDERVLANLAMDMAINPELIAAGWKLTPDAIMPAQYKLPDGQIAEWYFVKLREQEEKSGGKVKGKGKGKGKGDKPGVCSGCCGSVAGNGGDNESKQDEIDKVEGRSDIEQQHVVRSTAEAIRKHAEQQGRGRIPSSFIEMAELIAAPPKVDWKAALSQTIRKVTGRIKSGGKDFSMKRPSKRSYARGVMRPGLIQQMPEICIIRDTSGSMGQEQINQATIESIALIKAAGVDTVWYIDADAGVAFQKRVRLAELATLPVHGRGGTDFRPAVEAAAKLRPRPNVTIYITDGDGYAPPKGPVDMEFIWCVIPSYYNRRPADWGHHIIISEENVVLKDPHRA